MNKQDKECVIAISSHSCGVSRNQVNQYLVECSEIKEMGEEVREDDNREAQYCVRILRL